LRSQIIGGEFHVGAKLPKHTELATAFDVSSVTVQRALDELAADGFVRAHRGRGTFVSDHPPHLATYALVTPTKIGGRPRSLFYEGLERAAVQFEQQSPCRVPVFHFDSLNAQDTEYHRLLRAIRRRMMAGIIFAHHPFGFAGTPVLETPGLPRVAVMKGIYASVAPVEVGFEDWFDMAAQHLLEHGRKRVAWIGGHATSPAETHLRVSRLRELGLDVPSEMVHGLDTTFSFWVSSIIQLILRADPARRPNAIIISDDNLVEATTAALRDAGARVPADITVFAYANLPYRPRAMVPVTFLGPRVDHLLKMCTDAIDAQRAGRTAGDLGLMKMIPEFATDEDLS
jgi:DNA-binding LacI/PurR family transcriptional regulator